MQTPAMLTLAVKTLTSEHSVTVSDAASVGDLKREVRGCAQRA